MTPLAQWMLKSSLDWSKPIETRRRIRDLLHDAHCFDVTGVVDAATDLAAVLDVNPKDLERMEDLLFLPAPRTWLEFRWIGPPGENIVERQGFLLENMNKGSFHLTQVFLHCGEFYIAERQVFNLSEVSRLPSVEHDDKSWCLTLISVLLSMINTPRIIGRRQHMPHRGLEKSLSQALGRGKFPLHAWTEIKLHVAKPIEIDDGEMHEAHLTGRRALHFCRAHLRIRLGRLEYVSSHWRGDPAIGMKRSRYAVMA